MLQNNPAGELELALRIRALFEGQDALVNLARSFLDINRSTEQLMLGLKAVTGTLEGAQRDFDFLTGAALDSGLSIETLGQNFLKLTASSKGTLLEGQRVRDMFVDTSHALMVLGADAITTTRAFNAMAQMMSKGQIYSEELKGQLAEAIPGALNIMSRALGMTTQQMLGLMEKGLLTSEALVLFGKQLRIEFGTSEESARTFNQVINDVINQWTLLMKAFGDTGTWDFIKSAVSTLATNMNVLAGVAGAGLGVAVFKVAAGLRSLAQSAIASAAAMNTSTTATEVNAVATMEKARADLAAAVSARNEALARKMSADAALLQARTAAEVAAAQRIASAATSEYTVRVGMLTAAQRQMAVAQTEMAAATTFASRAMSVLFGPVGMIALAIGSALMFAKSFGDVGEASEIAAQKLDEYAKSVQGASISTLTANSDELIALERAAKAQEQKAEAAARTAQQNVKVAETIRMSAEGEADYERAVALSIAAEDEKRAAQEKLEEIQRKLMMTRAELITRVGTLADAEGTLSLQSQKLQTQLEAQREETNRLKNGVDDGTASYGEYSKAQLKEIEIATKLRETDIQLNDVRQQRTKVEYAIQKQAEANVDATGRLTKGTAEYQKAVDEEAEAIRKKFQAMQRLSDQMVEAEIATRRARAEAEAHATISKSLAEALQNEAKMVGEGARQREIAVQLKQLDLSSSREQLDLANKERASIEIELSLKRQQLALGTDKEKQVKEEIGGLENLLIKKNAEIDARRQNIDNLKKEAMEAELASKTMSQSMTETEQKIKDINKALAERREEQKNTNLTTQEAGAIAQEIIDLEKQLAIESEKKAIIVRQGWEAIGQSSEEAATGMDFHTRKMIAGFVELASSGQMTSQQITDSFNNALSKANTLEELLALREAFIRLKDEGKISAEQLALGLADIGVKAAELASKLDPVSQALQKMGMGVPQTLEEIVKQMQAQVAVLTPQAVGVERSNEAFLKMAEAALSAAANGAKVDIEAIKMEASSRGLGDAFTELEEKTRKLDLGLQGVAAIKAKMAGLTRDYVAAVEQEQSAVTSAIKSAIEWAEASGRENDARRLKIDLLQTEASQAVQLGIEKKKQIDLEVASEQANRAVLMAIQDKNAADWKSIEVITQKIAALEASKKAVDQETDAVVAGANKQIDAIRAATRAKEEQASVNESSEARSIRMSEAAKKAEGERAQQAKAAGSIISDFYNNALGSVAQLSDRAAIAFKQLRGEIIPTGNELDKLRQTTENVDRMLAQVSAHGGGGFVAFLRKITADANEVRRAFIEQAEAADILTERLNAIGEGAQGGIGAFEALIREAELGEKRFNLLDDVRLDGLKQALDQAKRKIAEMNQATEDARVRLQELNAELLEAKGMDDKAKLLRQELDYQEQLASIEAERAKAEAMGNRELVAILDMQKAKLAEINSIKLSNLEADARAKTRENESITRTREATSAMSDYARAIEAAKSGAAGLAETDLSNLVKHSNELKQNFKELSGIL